MSTHSNRKIKAIVLQGFSEVYLSGEQGNQRLKKAKEKGEIEIKDDIWDALFKYAEGVDIKNPLNIKL